MNSSCRAFCSCALTLCGMRLMTNWSKPIMPNIAAVLPTWPVHPNPTPPQSNQTHRSPTKRTIGISGRVSTVLRQGPVQHAHTRLGWTTRMCLPTHASPTHSPLAFLRYHNPAYRSAPPHTHTHTHACARASRCVVQFSSFLSMMPRAYLVWTSLVIIFFLRPLYSKFS